jgi:hypothetical protein
MLFLKGESSSIKEKMIELGNHKWMMELEAKILMRDKSITLQIILKSMLI